MASLAAFAGVAGPGPSLPAAAAASCTTTPSSISGISIVDPSCGFEPSTNSQGTTISKVYTGILPDTPAGGQPGGESAYRIEVPLDWNGTLVMYAHGYRGNGTTVHVGSPELRSYFIDHGYAWAASSYALNGYDVGTGVVDTHDLLQAFPKITGQTPARVIMSGLSMGGEITAVEIEYYRNTYAGAMPYCGVLGANDLFNYYLGDNVTAAALTGTKIQYPLTLNTGVAYGLTYDNLVLSELSKLGITPSSSGTSFATDLTVTGQRWADTVEQLSGGKRPGFSSALAYWDSFGFPPLTNIPFLFGLYPGLSGGTIGYADGNVAGNTNTVYRFSSRPGRLSALEKQLNASVLRVAPTATPSDNPTVTELPGVAGNPGIPVLSIHGLGDLFVPLSMDQRYNQLMIANGEGNLFVDRTIREVRHCGYTPSELASGFSALVNWIQTGQRPAGDNILNPTDVASPTFGCRFTDPTPGSHPNFHGVPCPAHLTGPPAGAGPAAHPPAGHTT